MFSPTQNKFSLVTLAYTTLTHPFPRLMAIATLLAYALDAELETGNAKSRHRPYTPVVLLPPHSAMDSSWILTLLAVLCLSPSTSALLWPSTSVPWLYFPLPFCFPHGDANADEATPNLQLGAWHPSGPRDSNQGWGRENDCPDAANGDGEQRKSQTLGMGTAMGLQSPPRMSPLPSWHVVVWLLVITLLPFYWFHSSSPHCSSIHMWCLHNSQGCRGNHNLPWTSPSHRGCWGVTCF